MNMMREGGCKHETAQTNMNRSKPAIPEDPAAGLLSGCPLEAPVAPPGPCLVGVAVAALLPTTRVVRWLALPGEDALAGAQHGPC